MFRRFRNGAIPVICALALAAVPAGAQPAGPPPAVPQPSGLPAVPNVPPVPSIGAGQPISLAEAVATSLQRNFTIQQAALQILVDRAAVAQAESGLLPTVKLAASYTGQTPLTSTSKLNLSGIGEVTVTTTAAAQNYATSLTLNYSVYTGEAVQDQIAIARAKLAADEAGLRATVATTVLQVRQAYYNVEATLGQVASAQRAVDAAQENVRVTEVRVRVGTSPQFDLLQAQVLRAAALQTLSQQKANAVSAQYTLDTLLNLPLSTIVTETTPLGLPQPPQNLDALIQQGLRLRPELVAARANIAGAQAAINLAESGLRPNITLSGGPSISTSTPDRTPVNVSGTLALTLAVFDGGLTKAKVDQARAQLRQAQVSEQQTAQAVESQVRTAYLNLQQSAEQLRAAQAGLLAAREALRIANVRFAAGVGTQLEVVTAQQNLAAADSATVQAQFNYNLAIAQIDQSAGTQVTF